MGISFGQRMVCLHITRTLLHTQLSHQAHKEQMTIQHSPISTQTHHQPLHHAHQQSDASTGWMRQSHPSNDGQSQELSSRTGLTTQACVQTNPHQFEETITPDYICNTQQVPRVQAPASIHTPHTKDNRQIMRSMQPQAPIPRVPTDIPTVKPISTPCIATIIKSSSKPTTLAAELSKRKHQHKRQASWLHNAVTPPIPTTRIRTQAQVATAAAWVAPPSLNTHSRMQQSGVPPPTCRPGYAAAIMKQQRYQCGLVWLSRHITRLENKVHQAMAVMDKDTGKLLNYRQLMNSPKYKKAWSRSAANEFGWLANGIRGRIKNPTNTIEFISQYKVPADRSKDVTYGQVVCSVRPKKAEPNQMQFMAGGYRIDYPGEVTTLTAGMLVAKMLFNSVISTKGARFMTMDIFNFYLMKPLHRAKFIQIKFSDIPNESSENSSSERKPLKMEASKSAVSFLFNLGAARQQRSVLF
jgi:hypothetical protein